VPESFPVAQVGCDPDENQMYRTLPDTVYCKAYFLTVEQNVAGDIEEYMGQPEYHADITHDRPPIRTPPLIRDF